MIKIKIHIFILLILLFSSNISATFKVAPYKSFISDYTNTLNKEISDFLENVIIELQEKTGAEIAVIILNTTNDIPIEEYAVEFGQQNGVGKKKEDNGVVFVVAIDDKKMFIATGYGIEGILPDGKIGRIRDEIIIPYFKRGDYKNGITAGVVNISKIIADNYKIELNSLTGKNIRVLTNKNLKSKYDNFLVIIVIIIIIINAFFSMIFKKKYYKNNRYGGRFFGGGFGGFGGSGFGGGFGGFSGGGGGSFGGGGSGGGW